MKQPHRFNWTDKPSASVLASQFDADGFLIIDDFYSADACQDVLAQRNKLVEAFDPTDHAVIFGAQSQSHAAHEYFMESANNISFFLEEGAVDETGQLTRDKHQAINKLGHAMHDLDPTFSAFARAPQLAQLATILGMKQPQLLQSMVICKPPQIGGEVGCHQDSTFLYTEPDSCIGFWVALEAATLENGCMWAAAGAHKGPLRSRFMRDANGMQMHVIDDTAMPEADTPLEAPVGTLVVLHGRLPHQSAANRSANSRSAFTLHVVDGVASYADENWLQRAPDFPARGF